MLVRQDHAFAGKLIKNGWLNIGITEALAVLLLRRCNGCVRATELTNNVTLVQVGILRNLVVLTVTTGEITANSRNRPSATTGQEMIKWLFLHGISVLGHKFAIHQRMQPAIPVFPDSAAASGTRLYLAAMRAELTRNTAILLL